MYTTKSEVVLQTLERESCQTCRRGFGGREQAAFVCGGSWQQEALFPLLLQQMLHVGHPAANTAARHRLEVLAVAQHVRAQLLQTHDQMLEPWSFGQKISETTRKEKKTLAAVK